MIAAGRDDEKHELLSEERIVLLFVYFILMFDDDVDDQVMKMITAVKVMCVKKRVWKFPCVNVCDGISIACSI